MEKSVEMLLKDLIASPQRAGKNFLENILKGGKNANKQKCDCEDVGDN